MSSPSDRGATGWSGARLALLLAALLALCGGWYLLWFLTDDAFIAFRYVGNRQLGHGYVWNAPPFLPVEGYTSFLWLVLLDGVWSLLGVEPPESANLLGLLFGGGTICLTGWMVLRLRLPKTFEPLRTSFLAIALLGVVTNFNFVMWTSSGLETSLFNFLFAAWVGSALFKEAGSRSWIRWVSLTAGLISLTRPDGLLVVAATGALLVAVRLAAPARFPIRSLGRAWPLALPVIHVLWRRHFYGDWLPNTYWAKHVAPWPEAGVRYLASYALEYGLWFWLGAALLALALGLRRYRPTLASLPVAVVVATVIAHIGYYVLRVGGDHFEYRIFSHSVPLVLVSSVWIAGRLSGRLTTARPVALLVPVAVVLLSWPIPWTIWSQAQRADTRTASFNLTIPVAPLSPSWLAGYATRLDALQRWLIVDHAIGKRHQEHLVFVEFRKAMFPRTRQLETRWPENSVYSAISVGIAGWVLADAHLIDRAGLNDYVIARNPIDDVESRRMAHDRVPPDGYLSCFHPNMMNHSARATSRGASLSELQSIEGVVRVFPHKDPLTAAGIRRCESIWRMWILDPR